MPRRLRIRAGDLEVTAALNDTRTADAIWEALPLSAPASRWGDEIYFSIPVEPVGEPGQGVVESGDLGYWPPGTAFCIFFGPTPASQGDEIRPASPVVVFGHVEGDARVFKQVPPGTQVDIEALTV